MAWALAMCDAFVPPGESVATAKTLLELMWDNPTIFFPTAEEEHALTWYTGDRDKLTPGNIYFYRVMSEHRSLMKKAWIGPSNNFSNLIGLHKLCLETADYVQEISNVRSGQPIVPHL
jgi:hypothetical protein